MEYSTIGKGQKISAEGVVYDKGSVYGRLQGLTDIRKARGKRYSLTTLLMIVLLAKMSGADTPTAIAEWAIIIRMNWRQSYGSNLNACQNGAPIGGSWHTKSMRRKWSKW